MEKQANKTSKPRKRLTIKQSKFIDEFIANEGNGTKAALKVYDTDDYFTGNAIAVENLQKPLIIQALDTRFEEVQEFYKVKARRAAEITAELMEGAEDDRTKLLAAKDLQDRAGHKPIEKTHSLSVKKIMIDL